MKLSFITDTITYAYRGLFSVIYFIFGKKEKINEMLLLDKEEQINLDTDNSLIKRKEGKLSNKNNHLMDKISFRYKAKNKDGKKVNGTFEAYNIEQAKKYLVSSGLEIETIAPRGKYDFDIMIGSPLSYSDIAFGLTQIATYIRAGITLVDSVKIIAKQTTKPAKKKIYDMIVYDLLAGDDFSTALEKQSKVFPKLLINMIKSSELTGDLPNVLDEMSNYYSSIARTRKEIKSAMTYPTVVFIFAIIVVTFVLIWIVPQYESMFSGFGAELPPITVMTVNLSNFLKNNLLYILIIIIVFLLLYLYLYKNVRSFRKTMQNIYLHLPIAKNIIMYSEVSMFARTFASLLNHGVYITDSMDVLMHISENEVYRSIIIQTVKNLNSGGKISDAFKDHWAFPMVAYEMIVTGENTGELGTMMEKVADYYDGLHRATVSSIKSLIEPFLIVFLAGSVGAIILAVILPMFQMYEVIA